MHNYIEYNNLWPQITQIEHWGADLRFGALQAHSPRRVGDWNRLATWDAMLRIPGRKEMNRGIRGIRGRRTERKAVFRVFRGFRG